MPRYVENCCGLCPWPLHSRHDLARWLIGSYFRIEENGLPYATRFPILERVGRSGGTEAKAVDPSKCRCHLQIKLNVGYAEDFDP